MSPPPAPRPDFRPDLEGLRGVAILLVVLYHAGVSWLAGGFVGVDVFFVLSGYFITGLIVRELATPATADLPTFYARRALRLLPPLLVVLLATLALVTWLYAPIDRAAVTEAGRAVALSTSNVHFARESVDYFSRAENPLLHTWSLAVEEQFYLVWPLLLVLFALGAESRRADASRVTLGGIAVVGIASLAASISLTLTAQPWAFFGLPTRLWEFALGGALALATAWRAGERVGSALQLAGLVAVGAAVALVDGLTPYPGVAAVLPALGAVALVAGGRHAPEGPVTRALAAPPLRWLGRLSYAWYLWHWPLVGLGAVLDPSIGVVGKLAWSALALGLAWLTYWLVEYPARAGRLARLTPTTVSVAAFAASVVAALIAYGATAAARRAASDPVQRRLAAAREDRMKHDCWVSGDRRPTGACVFGDSTSSTVVALVGDSHAEHWLGALDRVGKARGWKIVPMVMGGCPVADGVSLGGGRRARRSRACTRFNDRRLERVLALRPAAVVLSSWDHYVRDEGASWGAASAGVDPADWKRALRRTYERVARSRVPTVVIRGTPRTGFDVPACLSRRAARLPLAGDCTYPYERAWLAAARDAQTEAARGLPLVVVDMNDQICTTARCPTVRDGVVMFTDDNHLTASFSRMAGPVLGARVAAAVGSLGGRLP